MLLIPALPQPWLVCGAILLFHEYVWLLIWRAANTKVRVGAEATLTVTSILGITLLPKLAAVPAVWVAPLTLTCLLFAISGVLMAVFSVISPETSMFLWLTKMVLFAGVWVSAPLWLIVPASISINSVWIAVLLAGPYSIPIALGIVLGIVILAISLVLFVIVGVPFYLFKAIHATVSWVINAGRDTAGAFVVHSSAEKHDIINQSIHTGIVTGGLLDLVTNNFRLPFDDSHNLHPAFGLVSMIAIVVAFVWRAHASPSKEYPQYTRTQQSPNSLRGRRPT